MKRRFNTKFSALTLVMDKEPEEFIIEALKKSFPPMRIFHELNKIATRHKIPMVDKRTVYHWIDKCKRDIESKKNESPQMK